MFTGLSIVIVNLDLKKDTAECIDSFLHAGASLDQLIVVDNGSSDGSVIFLHDRFGNSLSVLEAKQNLGYANGVNIGIREALKCGSKWIMVMNNDTIVAPDFLFELEKASRQNPTYSIIGPLILYYSHPDKIWYFGDRLIPGTLITRLAYRGEKIKRDFPEIVPVDFVHGCGMLVQMDVFKKIGLFDTSYFMYADEADFCWRSRQAGFHIGSAPHAKMWHKVSTYMKGRPPKMRYFIIRSQIWYYRRQAKSFQIPIMVCFTIIRMIRLGVEDIFRRRFDMIPAMLHGWRDGWLGKMTPPEIPFLSLA